jgi:hypothetical protein
VAHPFTVGSDRGAGKGDGAAHGGRTAVNVGNTGAWTGVPDVCQPGGDFLQVPPDHPFTGNRALAGAYVHPHGSGLASFTEDAGRNHRMTLIGRIAR